MRLTVNSPAGTACNMLIKTTVRHMPGLDQHTSGLPNVTLLLEACYCFVPSCLLSLVLYGHSCALPVFA